MANNIEYLWRSMLLSQDKIMTRFDGILNSALQEKIDEFCHDKKTYLTLIHKMKEDIQNLNQKYDSTVAEFESK